MKNGRDLERRTREKCGETRIGEGLAVVVRLAVVVKSNEIFILIFFL